MYSTTRTQLLPRNRATSEERIRSAQCLGRKEHFFPFVSAYCCLEPTQPIVDVIPKLIEQFWRNYKLARPYKDTTFRTFTSVSNGISTPRSYDKAVRRYPVSVHEGYFIHKSRALRGQLYSEGEPFMVNGLVARRPLL